MTLDARECSVFSTLMGSRAGLLREDTSCIWGNIFSFSLSDEAVNLFLLLPLFYLFSTFLLTLGSLAEVTDKMHRI